MRKLGEKIGRCFAPSKTSIGGSFEADIKGRIGSYDLEKIRNEMLIMDFPVGKIEPSLGGMVRVIHAMKKGKNKFEISPRLKSYFRERLELESYHIDYIMKKSEKIVRTN